MRRLWPAIGVCALAAACGRPNPGFKLLDSSDAGDSEGHSASLGTTEPGSASGSGTATGTPTGTDPTGMVTASATASSDGTNTTLGETTDTTGDTTMAAGHWEFPTDCGEPQEQSEWFPAVLDTFFMYAVPAGGCGYAMGGAGPECQDLQFSLSSSLELFRVPTGDPTDNMSVFAVRFKMPEPMYQGMVLVPPEAFLSAEARIRLFRPLPKVPWNGAKLELRRLAEGDSFVAEEGLEFTPCLAPAASYRCRVCNLNMVDGPCAVNWTLKGAPFDKQAAALATKTLGPQDEPDANVGADLMLGPFAAGDLSWLTGDGLLLLPATAMPQGTLEVKTLESGDASGHPALRVRYCTPQYVLD